VLELLQNRASIVSARVLIALVTFVAYILVGLLTHLNHTRTRRSSTILLTLWPLYLVEQAVVIRTQVLLGLSREPVFGLRCALLGVGVIAWALECFCPDRAKLDPDAEPEEKELPYERANVYNRLTYVERLFLHSYLLIFKFIQVWVDDPFNETWLQSLYYRKRHVYPLA
jgi:hypothetical protein